jgi:cobalt/nickel transport system permease protein
VVGALALILSVTLVPAGRLPTILGFAILLAVLAAVSRIPARHFAGRIALVLPFALVVGAFLPFVRPGIEGWTALGVLVLRSSLAAATLVLLVSTTGFPVILKALARFGVPRILTVLLSFAYRFIFVLVEEAERMEMAVRSRAPFRSGRFRALAGALGVLFIRTYERGERVYLAMLARGFTGDPPAGETTRFGARDAGAAAVLTLGIGLAWALPGMIR